MIAKGLHARSMRFADEQVELCRFNRLAAYILLEDARNAREVHEANRTIRQSNERLQHAINKRDFEKRQLA